ncbi:MAG TPA: TonB-dependent receptor [Thermoanaerobaculia bacterium]|nr:TonB-dependent receptor [Thermoanaerobaculia bacterium]
MTLLVSLILTLPLPAAITSSALTGRVMIGDVPASGATVTLTLRETQTVRTATTNGRGTYWLGALAPGQYDVSFSRAGATSLTRPVAIELGRVARADARLEPSEDEESITSTATTVSVAHTTAVTTHFSATELERIPLRVSVTAAEALSPVLPPNDAIVDDTAMFFPALLGEEALDEVTIMRGAQPIELDRTGSSVILARTRSGSDQLFLSLRDTYSTHNGGGHVLESTSGGKILPQRLWFFAAGWGGDATDVHLQRLRGLALKLSAQAGASHHFVASHIDADAKLAGLNLGSSATSVRYTGVIDERLTAEAIVSNANGDTDTAHLSDDAVAAKISYRLADHVISAGGSDVESLFLSDRWASGRWTVDAGVRREEERTLSRVALAFDLRSGQGSHAIVANWGEYLDRQSLDPDARVLRVAGIGYTSSLESSGTARIDFFHYEGARDMDQVQADARYRIFDRFEAGGSYVYTRTNEPLVPEHLASVRVGLQLPIAGREFAAMLLERYDSVDWTTDLGIRYEIPFRRVALTLAADATNLFESAESRIWARVRY